MSKAPSLDLVFEQLVDLVNQAGKTLANHAGEELHRQGGVADSLLHSMRREQRESAEHNLRLFEDLLENFMAGQSELDYHPNGPLA